MSRITINSVKEFAKSSGQKQIIVFGWDGRKQHVATYGIGIENCDQAAQAGDVLKKLMKWEGVKQ